MTLLHQQQLISHQKMLTDLTNDKIKASIMIIRLNR